MNVDSEVHQKPVGKVLLYTSREDGSYPAMAIKHEVTSKLPSVLKGLARNFSPIRSKYIILYWPDNS